MPRLHAANIISLIVVAAAFGLDGCAAPTTILSSANPSRAPAGAWSDDQTLPVDVHGTAPGHNQSDLTALFTPYHPARYAALGQLPSAPRRIVLYVNPAYTPRQSQLCDGAQHFPRRVQHGQSAYVVGALCDGTQLITMASAKILTENPHPADLAYNFNIIRDQLYQSLFPGANDPDKYFEVY